MADRRHFIPDVTSANYSFHHAAGTHRKGEGVGMRIRDSLEIVSVRIAIAYRYIPEFSGVVEYTLIFGDTHCSLGFPKGCR